MQMVASFSLGLRNNSRIKLKLSGQKESNDTLILAMILDDLRAYLYGKDKPASAFETLQGIDANDNKEFMIFKDASAFEKARSRLIKGE